MEADEQFELWRTDGSRDGTVRVSGSADPFFEPRDAIDVNNRLYFVAEDAERNSKIWTVDDVNSRVAPVSDQVFDNLHPLMASNGQLFFYATGTNEPSGHQLWMLDETESRFVAVMGRGPYDWKNETYITRQNREQTKTELWRFDETGGLEPVVEIPVGKVHPKAAENQLFFTGGSNLWRSDGTTEGTYSLSNANPHTSFRALRVVGDKLFFLASTEATDGGPRSKNSGSATGPPKELSRYRRLILVRHLALFKWLVKSCSSPH